MAQNCLASKGLTNSPVITTNMVKELQLPSANVSADGNHQAQSEAKWTSPHLMIIFDGGDLNSAMHYLLESLHQPFADGSVATLLIQESILEQFINRAVEHFKELDPKVAQHPNYRRTLDKIKKLKAKVVQAPVDKVSSEASPTLVFDFIQSYLGEGPTGVITLHTFRTAKEASQVYGNEKLCFDRVSIWNEKLACAYEIVALLKAETFMVNCFNVDLKPIRDAVASNRNDVCLAEGYHYETLMVNSKRKVIVFPVGTIFAN